MCVPPVAPTSHILTNGGDPHRHSSQSSARTDPNHDHSPDEFTLEDNDSVDYDSEPELLDMEFDVRSKEGRLPDSSYNEDERWFTWNDFTGTWPNVYMYMVVLYQQ